MKLKTPPRMPIMMACMHRILITMLIDLDRIFKIIVRIVVVLLAPILCVPVDEPHVEEGREHEGEAGDEHGADQLEDGAEAGQGLGQEQEDQHHAGPERNPLPVEGRLNAEDVLKKLV